MKKLFILRSSLKDSYIIRGSYVFYSCFNEKFQVISVYFRCINRGVGTS